MAGPGGTEVGRVSVKVVPDTDDFRRELRRELKDVEKTEKVNIPVEVDTAQAMAEIEKIKAELASIRDQTVRIRIDQQQAISNLTKDLNASFTSATKLGNALRGVFGKSERNELNLFQRVAQTGLTGFAKVADVAVNAASKLGETLGDFLTKAVSSTGQGIASMVTSMIAWIPILSTIGGLVMFIGGALAAAFVGLPVVITALAAPIAAVVLGLDGIKKAAKQLTPAIDAIKNRLSDTFEKTLTPVFKNLGKLMPALSDGLNVVAISLSKIIKGFVDFASSEHGIRLVREALEGVSRFLDAIQPGLQSVFEMFLDIAGTVRFFDQLGNTVDLLAKRFSRFLADMKNSGDLDKGLKNLGDTLYSLSGLFYDLLQAATRFFNGAAPGMNKFFDALGRFFLRIDWERLGTAFGGVFAKLGEFVDNLDPATIEAFTDIFTGIADAITDLVDGGSMEALVTGFALVLDIIIGVVRVLDFLLEAFHSIISFDWGAALDGIGNFFKGIWEGAVEAFEGVQQFIMSIPERIRGWLSGAGSALKERGAAFIQGLRDGVVERWNAVMDFIRSIPERIRSALSTAGSWLLDTGRRIMDGLRNGVTNAWNTVMGFFRSIPGLVMGAFAGAGGWLLSAGRRIIDGLISGIQSAIGRIQSVLGGITNLIPDWKGPADVDSKLLVKNGELIIQGLNEGLSTGFQSTQKLLNGMTNDLSTAFSDPALINTTTQLGADVTGNAASQLTVSGSVDGLEAAVVAALSDWDVVLDDTGMARLVNRGNQKLGRR